MTVQGRAAHAGAAPEQGRNALIELAHQLLQTRDVAAGIKGAQLNWTTAEAGSVRNQIPQSARAGGDVRVTEPGANEKLQAALQARVRQSPLVPDTTTTVTLVARRPIYVAGAKGEALADMARSIYAELDGRHLLMHPGTNGGTDAGFAPSLATCTQPLQVRAAAHSRSGARACRRHRGTGDTGILEAVLAQAPGRSDAGRSPLRASGTPAQPGIPRNNPVVIAGFPHSHSIVPGGLLVMS